MNMGARPGVISAGTAQEIRQAYTEEETAHTAMTKEPILQESTSDTLFLTPERMLSPEEDGLQWAPQSPNSASSPEARPNVESRESTTEELISQQVSSREHDEDSMMSVSWPSEGLAGDAHCPYTDATLPFYHRQETASRGQSVSTVHNTEPETILSASNPPTRETAQIAPSSRTSEFPSIVSMDEDFGISSQPTESSQTSIIDSGRPSPPISLRESEPRPYNYIPPPIPYSPDQPSSSTSLVHTPIRRIPNTRTMQSNASPAQEHAVKTLKVIFETPDNDFDYEDPIAFCHLETWTIAEFFQFYVDKSKKPAATVTKLELSIGFGKLQSFVVERYGVTGQWDTVKSRIKALFDLAKKRKPLPPTFDVLVEG